MKRIVLLRHGESTWNKDNRFTGWTDVDLTEKGIADANQAGILLKEKGFHFDKAYTSFLKRAVKTLNCVLDKMDQDWIPVEKSWRLNEKHYGALQGLNKSETASKYGEEQVLIWRRSFNVAPNALPEDDPRNPAAHDMVTRPPAVIVIAVGSIAWKNRNKDCRIRKRQHKLPFLCRYLLRFVIRNPENAD